MKEIQDSESLKNMERKMQIFETCCQLRLIHCFYFNNNKSSEYGIMTVVLFYNRPFPLQEKDHDDLFFNTYRQNQGFVFSEFKSAARGKSSAIRYSSKTNRRINIYNPKAIRRNAKLHIRLIGPILT